MVRREPVLLLFCTVMRQRRLCNIRPGSSDQYLTGSVPCDRELHTGRSFLMCGRVRLASRWAIFGYMGPDGSSA